MSLFVCTIRTVEAKRKRQCVPERNKNFHFERALTRLGLGRAFTKIKALLMANPISNSLFLNSNELFEPFESTYDIPDYRA